MGKYTKQYFAFIVFILILSFGFAPKAQQGDQPSNQPQTQQTEAPAADEGDSILLTVLRGNPEKGGGETQEYQLKNGETVFIKVDQSDDSDKEKVDIPYEAKVDQLSTQISNKITDIESKQKEYSDEIYPAFRPPVDLEKQAMESELQNLRMQRDQLESEQRSKQAVEKIQKATSPRPKPKVAKGLNVQPTIDNGNVSFDITPKGLKGDNATETNIQAPAGKWVKVLGKDDAGGSELWIKAELSKSQ